MKKFKFIEPFKTEVQYPNINSVYREEGDDEDGGKDFFSYEDGVDVDNETVQNWVNECVQDLLDNPEQHYSYRQSGNTLVIATKNQQEINIFVSKSHIESNIPLYEYNYE